MAVIVPNSIHGLKSLRSGEYFCHSVRGTAPDKRAKIMKCCDLDRTAFLRDLGVYIVDLWRQTELSQSRFVETDYSKFHLEIDTEIDRAQV